MNRRPNSGFPFHLHHLGFVRVTFHSIEQLVPEKRYDVSPVLYSARRLYQLLNISTEPVVHVDVFDGDRGRPDLLDCETFPAEDPLRFSFHPTGDVEVRNPADV